MGCESCNSAGEHADAGDGGPCGGTFDGAFPVFGEAAAAPEPCESAFDHPAPWQQHEALGGVGALDDLQRPFAVPLERVLEFVPGIPRRQLVGFQRVPLKAGERRRLSFAIDPRELAHWDALSKAWVLEAGTYEVMVGSSSGDIRLRSHFQIIARGQWSESS